MPVQQAHPLKVRNLAFRLWCENGKNMSKVCQVMFDEYGIKVSVKAILTWRDNMDWEAKLLLRENQFRRLLRASDDPILHEMAMDDVMVMKFLGILTRMVSEQLNRRSTRQLFQPRNIRELMQIITFISENQSRILGAQQERDSNPSRTTNITIDNRRLILRDRLAAVPSAQRRVIVDQMRGATMDQKELAPVREEAFDDEAS